MIDRNVQYPTRYKLTKVEGTDNIYDLTPAPGTITAEGTMINKSTLLQDATAAMYGLGTDAVPDEVLEILSKALLLSNGTYTDILGNEAVITKIEYGNYVGTGVGLSVTLNFEKTPKIVFVLAADGANYFGAIFINGANSTKLYGNDSYHLTCQWGDNSLTWSGSSGMTQQTSLNAPVLYYYLAIYE